MLVAPSLRPPAVNAAGFLFLVLAIGFSPFEAPAHDPSAFGGLSRTRSGGATWFVANPAGFLNRVIAPAISPIDSNHLLLATESGLLRSRDAGLDWKIEAPNVVIGPAFAAAFLALLTLGAILTGYFLAPRDASSSLGKVEAS